jgi:hypothetical protein
MSPSKKQKSGVVDHPKKGLCWDEGISVNYSQYQGISANTTIEYLFVFLTGLFTGKITKATKRRLLKTSFRS